MSEIRCAVERINDPEIGLWGLFDTPSFFSQETMGWEACANAIDDALFCRMICVRYQICWGFVLDMKP